MTVSSTTMREIEEAFRKYEAEVEATAMTPNTKTTYLLHSRHFVRWLKGDFKPGEKLLRSAAGRRPR